MPEAYIVDAVRTPVGKRGGGLSTVHPADLGAATPEPALAPPPVPQGALIVTRSGDCAGVVNSNQGSLQCGATCSVRVPVDELLVRNFDRASSR